MTINSTSIAAIARSFTAEKLSSVSMHAQSSGLWTLCRRVFCDGLWLHGSRALRPPRLVFDFRACAHLRVRPSASSAFGASALMKPSRGS